MRAGSRYISALVSAKFCEWPPSIAYDASVNGAPPKPISGTPWGPSSSRRIIRIVSITCASASRGSKHFSRSMSASERRGFSIAGPSPRTKSNGIPIGSSGSSKSENKIAASTSMRRTGCIVTVVASSGDRQMSSSERRLRISRYSGMYRPACRMNHTGVRSTGSRLHAFRKRSFMSGGSYYKAVLGSGCWVLGFRFLVLVQVLGSEKKMRARSRRHHAPRTSETKNLEPLCF